MSSTRLLELLGTRTTTATATPPPTGASGTVLDILADLKKKLSLSFLFITHDIGVVQHIADRIIVMNKGRIVEQGSCDEVLKHPKEEYTKYLMASVPKIGKELV